MTQACDLMVATCKQSLGLNTWKISIDRDQNLYYQADKTSVPAEFKNHAI